jgi:CheY-like chemotaxis protein
MALNKEGWRVVEASGGEAAIDMARQLRPAAITLDIMMPRMDGWSVLTALKSDPELSDIPVVVVTCTSDRGLALSLGASDFMTKPVDRSRLGLVLNKLLDEAATVLVVDDDAMSRPFGVALLLAGWDEAGGPGLFHADPSGTFTRYDAKAIGSGSEGAQSTLQEQFRADMSLVEAQTLALSTLKAVMEEKVSATNVDIATVAPTYTLFTQLQVQAVIDRL